MPHINTTEMAKKVLVTGAGGFIGGFIVEEALSRGYEVWAAVRSTTSREYLSDPRIHFIELDFTDPARLAETLRSASQETGKWDYIIHNLGATKCANFADFNKINYGYLKLLVETLQQLGIEPERFLMMSSMSVLGTGDEKGYTPFTAKQIPMPCTKYGVSKLKAETFLQMQDGFPYIIFRPTGVYGPREKDYYLMIKSIAKGFDFSVGFRRQLLTFIYVKDLAKAIFDAIESGVNRKAYLIADEQPYTQREFRQIVKQELGKKFVIPVTAPLWIVKAVCAISEKIAVVRMKASTLNPDKYKILRQRNWTCDTSEARRDFNFSTRYDLRSGLHEAIEWYKAHNML